MMHAANSSVSLDDGKSLPEAVERGIARLGVGAWCVDRMGKPVWISEYLLGKFCPRRKGDVGSDGQIFTACSAPATMSVASKWRLLRG